MVTKRKTIRVEVNQCDFHQRPKTEGQRRYFGYQGECFEVDACARELPEIDEFFDWLKSYARPIKSMPRSPRQRSRSKRGVGRKDETPEERKKMRKWLADHGHEVGARGKISQQNREIYATAQSRSRSRSRGSTKAPKAKSKPRGSLSLADAA